MQIAGRKIHPTMSPYIVAEISGNHGGNIHNAIRLIEEAKKAGADAVKTQCYEADTLTLDLDKPDFIAQNGHWKGRKLYELYQRACTPHSWQRDLYKVAADSGIPIFSSVFDRRGVDLLEQLSCPCYKIASFEITDTPLIEYAAGTGKPLIISTGLANDQEIIEANEASGGKAAFLHCTSEYPGTIEQSDLGRIGHINALLEFKNPVGISDHTKGPIVPIAATALRAAIIEKHLRLADVSSEDSEFSLTGFSFGTMAGLVRKTHDAMLERASQKEGRQFRRSLYAVKDIEIGDILTPENIRSIRPGYGLPPKMLMKLLGTKAKRAFRMGDPLS